MQPISPFGFMFFARFVLTEWLGYQTPYFFEWGKQLACCIFSFRLNNFDLNFSRNHQNIYNWTRSNNLILNPNKSSFTLFTSDAHEHNDKLSLTIIDVVISTIRNQKILGLTLDPAFNFREHVKITKTKASRNTRILKALTATRLGKQKETLLATYKSLILPTIEYEQAPSGPQLFQTPTYTNSRSHKTMHWGCTMDTNIEHLHQETQAAPWTPT